MLGSRLAALGLSLAVIASIFAACGTSDDPMEASVVASSTSGGGAATVVSSSATGMGGSGGGPIQCGVAYTNIPKGGCDLLQQDCPLGYTCKPSGTNGGTWTTKCLQSSGLKQRGEVCFTDSECIAGLLCLINRCSPVCCPDGTNTPCGGGTCNFTRQLGKNQNGVEQTFQFCSYGKKCTLFDPSSCPPEVGAQPEYCHVSDAKQGLATCMPNSGNPKHEGESCAALNDCDANQDCRGTICRFLCDHSDWKNKNPGEGGCPPGQTCSDTAMYGIPNISVCLPTMVNDGGTMDSGPMDSGSDSGGDSGPMDSGAD